jgi:hypothetical protein
MADVADSLERQGVATFHQKLEDLIQSVTAELKNQGAQVTPEDAVRPVTDGGASDTFGQPSA